MADQDTGASTRTMEQEGLANRLTASSQHSRTTYTQQHWTQMNQQTMRVDSTANMEYRQF
jgi:hypothetical protein